MSTAEVILHATCVGLAGKGVLIIGEPGSGKSSLALALIDQPGHGLSAAFMTAELVADDQVKIIRQNQELVASAPLALQGLLEIRGLAIVTLVPAPNARLSLVVRLQAAAAISRLPNPQTYEILGIPLPMIEIDAQKPTAPARLRAAVNLLC